MCVAWRGDDMCVGCGRTQNKITQKNAWSMNLLDHIRGLASAVDTTHHKLYTSTDSTACTLYYVHLYNLFGICSRH